MAQTVRQLSEKWERRTLKLWRKSSRRSARSHLKIHINPEFGDRTLDSVGLGDIQDFVSKLVDKGLAPKTVSNIARTLTSMFEDAVDWEDIQKRPRFERLKLPELGEDQRGRCYSPDQVKTILAQSVEPWRTLWLMCVVTGMRCGECLGMVWDNIDLPAREIHVRQAWVEGEMGPVKSKMSRRILPMPEELAGALLQHRLRQLGPNPMNLVFPNQIGRPLRADHVLHRHLKPILRRMGITGRGWGMHAFRHCQATQLYAVGADPKTVQCQLGHSDPRLALRLYTHRIPDHHRKAVERAAQTFTQEAGLAVM